MASGCCCRLVVLDSSFVVSSEAPKSWRLHSHVQYNYADFYALCYRLYTVYAQFFNALFPAATEHSSI